MKDPIQLDPADLFVNPPALSPSGAEKAAQAAREGRKLVITLDPLQYRDVVRRVMREQEDEASARSAKVDLPGIRYGRGQAIEAQTDVAQPIVRTIELPLH